MYIGEGCEKASQQGSMAPAAMQLPKSIVLCFPCAISNGETNRFPCRHEWLDFMSKLVSPAGTKGLPAGRKRPQTLLSRFEAPTGTKGLKEPR
jgi:hypothetical protein